MFVQVDGMFPEVDGMFPEVDGMFLEARLVITALRAASAVRRRLAR
jgi:hypothetical protein